MPRNVRPSWVTVVADGYSSPVSAGPRSRTGTLSAEFAVRSNGSVLPLLDVHALADGETVRYVVVDLRTGRELFSEVFEQ